MMVEASTLECEEIIPFHRISGDLGGCAIAFSLLTFRMILAFLVAAAKKQKPIADLTSP